MVSSWGGLWPGRVGVCPGGAWLGGGCVPGGGVAFGQGGACPGGLCVQPLWTEFLTHTCENITFVQLRLRTVINLN